MAARGHPGAAEISRSVLSVYGWAATTSEVGDQDFDALTRAILGEESVREALLEHNPWALEEMGRRLLEAKSRGLWSPDPECLAILERAYLQAEGALEETLEAHGGEAQGGAVDVLTTRDLSKWRNTIDEARARVGLGPIRGPEGAPS
jgi:cobaltochelatase CobN